VVLDSNGGLSCTVVEASRAVQAVSVSNGELGRTVVEASRAGQAVSASVGELSMTAFAVPASCSKLYCTVEPVRCSYSRRSSR
jgi:hypothetical protein